jgi:hypothetical protein
MQSLEKKRKYEEGQDLQNLYQSLFQDNSLPTPSILQTTRTNSTIMIPDSLTTDPNEDSIPLDTNIQDFEKAQQSVIPPDSNPLGLAVSQSENPLTQQSSFYEFSNLPSSEIIRAFNDMDFGIARKDLEKDRKRFEWIPEELNYLQHYIESIEKEVDKKNRYSACLNHLRSEASPDIKKYFHPHHVANSDRLKNGFKSIK